MPPVVFDRAPDRSDRCGVAAAERAFSIARYSDERETCAEGSAWGAACWVAAASPVSSTFGMGRSVSDRASRATVEGDTRSLAEPLPRFMIRLSDKRASRAGLSSESSPGAETGGGPSVFVPKGSVLSGLVGAASSQPSAVGSGGKTWSRDARLTGLPQLGQKHPCSSPGGENSVEQDGQLTRRL